MTEQRKTTNEEEDKLADMQALLDETGLRIKAWWRSATIWINGAVIVVAGMGDMLPFIGQYMPDDSPIRWIAGAVAAATIYLRLFQTNQAVTVSAAMKPVTTDKLVTPDSKPA